MVTGVKPRATQSAKLRVSTPAENEIGTSGRARRYALDQVQRDHVERRPREVHHRLARREEAPVVAHHQRVGELDAGTSRPRERARSTSRSVDLERLVPLQVLLEVLGARLDLAVAQHVVEEAVHRVSCPSSVGLSFTVTWRPISSSRKRTIPSISSGRAAVEGGERDLVGERRAEVEVAEATQLVRDLARAGPPPRPARPSSTRSRTAPRASGCRRGRSPRSCRRSSRRGAGRRAARAAPRPAATSISIEPLTYSRRLSARRSSWLHSTL